MQENNESQNTESSNLNSKTESNAEGVNTADALPTTPTNPQPPTKKNKKLLLIVLLIAIIGGVVYVVLSPKKSSAPSITTAPPTTNQPTPTPISTGPQTLAYAVAGNDHSALDLFWSPADSDKATQSAKLGSEVYISQQAVKGEQIALGTEGGTAASAIWYSSDGGKTYNKIFEDKAKKADQTFGGQLTSLIFANDGKSIIFAYLPDNGSNTVRQITLDTAHTITDLYASDKRGVFLQAYNPSTAQLIYTDGCYNCDGNGSSIIKSTNVTSKTTSTLLDGKGASYQIAMNKAGTELLALLATRDDKLGTFGLPGFYDGPPYVLSRVDPLTGKQTTITTIGQKGTAKADGTVDAEYAQMGYMADGKTPYYFAGNQVFSLNKDKPSLLFEATKPILSVYYVSDANVVASSGAYNGYSVSKFDVSTKAVTTLISADDKTKIIGVTSK